MAGAESYAECYQEVQTTQSAECSALTVTSDGNRKQYTAAGDLLRSQQYFSLFNDTQTGCCVSLQMKFPHIRSAYLAPVPFQIGRVT